MMQEKNIVKKIIASAFVLFLFVGFIKNGSYYAIGTIFDYLKQDHDVKSGSTFAPIETSFIDSLWHKKEFIDLNGILAKLLKMQGFYSDMGMYITDDGYIVSSSDPTSTDYEYMETIALRDFLALRGVNLLYVNEPTKYLDDSLFEEEFGIETYSNRNADLFLSRIREAGVNTIDLRDSIKADGKDVSELFYRTDHHWTTPTGLWATKIMAQALNDHCGYHIDTSIYDPIRFTTREWKECWLGEQGRKVAETYVGLDDYTELKPNYETNFTFKDYDGTLRDGSFEDFIDETIYNTDTNVYENDSWHYAYDRIDSINNNVAEGRVLMICDSYDYVTQPFLSLGVHEVDSLIMRDFDDSFSLRNYIIEKGYDTVIIAYAQFMIGAHDDESSANFRMFTFDK